MTFPIPLPDLAKAVCFAGAVVAAALGAVWFRDDLQRAGDAAQQNVSGPDGDAGMNFNHAHSTTPGAQ